MKVWWLIRSRGYDTNVAASYIEPGTIIVDTLPVGGEVLAGVFRYEDLHKVMWDILLQDVRLCEFS